MALPSYHRQRVFLLLLISFSLCAYSEAPSGFYAEAADDAAEEIADYNATIRIRFRKRLAQGGHAGRPSSKVKCRNVGRLESRGPHCCRGDIDQSRQHVAEELDELVACALHREPSLNGAE